MAYKLKHLTLKMVNGYFPTSYENVPVKDGIATAQRPISVSHMLARGWVLIDESQDDQIPNTKPKVGKKSEPKKDTKAKSKKKAKK